MTFHQLEAACKANDLVASIYQYDCGERVTIKNGVGELFSSSKDCGEEPNAVDIAGSWLLSTNHIHESDIPPARKHED